MKKLLVLTLVLGVASLATAGLTIGGYNGEVLAPSDTLVLNVSTDVTLDNLGSYVLVVANSASGTVEGGAPTQGGLSSELNYYAGYFAYYAGAEGDSAIAGSVADAGATTIFDGVIYDGILFHCEGPIPAVVELYGSSDGATWVLEDVITIAQVPEPATMAILGLGALLIRRKK